MRLHSRLACLLITGLLLFILAPPARAQLSPPRLLPENLVATAPVPPSALLPDLGKLEAFCRAVQVTLDEAGRETSETESCAFETPKVFVLIRGQEGDVRTARFKLNSSAGNEKSDLESFRLLIVPILGQLGWSLPASMNSALEEGRRHQCQSGALRFDFARERGEVPRYNFILAPMPWPMHAADRFAPWIMPC
ncbi:MAG: hypothetical protein JWR39_511 [Devosia sp.]|nr:hypothetical protein [Devosia sp.]